MIPTLVFYIFAAITVIASLGVVGQRNPLERGAEHELARVQDERAVAADLDQLGEVLLGELRVDVQQVVSAEVHLHHAATDLRHDVDFDPRIGELGGLPSHEVRLLNGAACRDSGFLCGSSRWLVCS